MNRGERLSSILERMQEHAAVTSVYGDPVERNGRTIIPVARVAYGFGGGYGSPPHEETQAEDEKQGDDGGGMGGGVSATPTGVVEISDHETRFIPFDDRRKLAMVRVS